MRVPGRLYIWNAIGSMKYSFLKTRGYATRENVHCIYI